MSTSGMNILLLGSGRMGRAIARDIVHFGFPDLERLTIIDNNLEQLIASKQLIGKSPAVRTQVIDIKEKDSIVALMENHDTVISAISYFLNYELTEMAINTGTNFLDLGGNHEVVKKQLSLDTRAKEADIIVMPDNGLAPGLVNMLTKNLISEFLKEGWNVENVDFRVGGLPQRPIPPLDYSLVFAVEGLINEYVEPCFVIKDGKLAREEPLTGVEVINFEGFPLNSLECFHTSGGSSILPMTCLGLVRNLNYKTIRYKGHCDKFKLLVDLGLTSNDLFELDNNNTCVPRDLLSKKLEEMLPKNEKDVTLLRVQVSAKKEGKNEIRTIEIVDHYDEKTGMTSMMRMTAIPTAITAMIVSKGLINRKGSFIAEDCIDNKLLLAELARRDIIVRKKSSQPL
ncbi:MAG: saccharopine dehydrogenase family protein [Candidatus Hodarchaeales archaeon]|jgi:lysine 6-dehydrogenase